MEKRKHPAAADLISLAAVLMLAAAAGSLIPSLHIDNSVDIFMPDDHEVIVINDENEDIFGSQDVIMIAVSSRYDSVLTPQSLGVIREITEEAKALDHVDDVLSLANIDYIISSDWGMEVVDLYPGDMADSQAITELKHRLVDWKDVYRRTFISDDERMTSIIVQVEPAEGDGDWNGAVYQALRPIIDGQRDSGLDFTFAGEPVLMEEMTNSIVRDLLVLIPLSALIICVVMFLTFRRFEGVLFPMISLVVAALLTMGVMGIFGVTFTMASMLIPILLLVVGSAYCIHIMAHFYDVISQEEGFIGPEKIRETLATVVSEIRMSVFMAGFTTVAGFLSLMASPLGPFKTFALLTALGVAFSLISAFILLPILIRLRYRNGAPAEAFRIRSGRRVAAESPRRHKGRVFDGMALVVRRGRLPVLFITGILLLVTLSLIPRISTGMNFIDFFPRSSSVRRSLDRFNERMAGTGRITVRFDAPDRGDILDPDFLAKVDRFSNFMISEHGIVTTAASLVPQIRRINKIMNFDSVPYAEPEPASGGMDDPFADFFGGDAAPAALEDSGAGGEASATPADESFSYEQASRYMETALLDSGMNPDPEDVIRGFLAAGNYRGEAFNEIPVDPAKYGLTDQQDLKNLLAQYMVLYSGSLERIINDGIEPDKMLLSMTLNDEASAPVARVLDDIEAYWASHIPEDWSYHIAGSSTLINRVTVLITRSQIISLLVALVIIFIVLVTIYRSFVAGAIGLIPVLAGLMGLFLTMSLAGFNLDFITALLGSLAIGIGVDYAIHVLSAYRRSVQRGDDDTLDYVYRTTGRAVFFNATSVAAGFLALVLSNFVPLRQLGLLFALAMISSGVSSLVLVPMALEFFNPQFLRNGRHRGKSGEPDSAGKSRILRR